MNTEKLAEFLYDWFVENPFYVPQCYTKEGMKEALDYYEKYFGENGKSTVLETP